MNELVSDQSTSTESITSEPKSSNVTDNTNTAYLQELVTKMLSMLTTPIGSKKETPPIETPPIETSITEANQIDELRKQIESLKLLLENSQSSVLTIESNDSSEVEAKDISAPEIPEVPPIVTDSSRDKFMELYESNPRGASSYLLENWENLKNELVLF